MRWQEWKEVLFKAFLLPLTAVRGDWAVKRVCQIRSDSFVVSIFAQPQKKKVAYPIVCGQKYMQKKKKKKSRKKGEKIVLENLKQ